MVKDKIYFLFFDHRLIFFQIISFLFALVFGLSISVFSTFHLSISLTSFLYFSSLILLKISFFCYFYIQFLKKERIGVLLDKNFPKMKAKWSREVLKSYLVGLLVSFFWMLDIKLLKFF